jgi:hypothetical protein
MTDSSLAICILTVEPVARVQALVDDIRSACDEIVVGIDNAHIPGPIDEYAELTGVDRLFTTTVDLPIEKSLRDLMSACTADWVFRLDSDELISAELRSNLSDLDKLKRRFTHAWVPRRWIWPDTRTYLDGAPWFPDLQLRLFRNLPALWTISTQVHAPAHVEGHGCTLPGPLYHLDLVSSNFQARVSKASRYESQRPGLRTHNGNSTNFATYLPESLTASLDLREVPHADYELLIARSRSRSRSTTEARAVLTELPKEPDPIDANSNLTHIEIKIDDVGYLPAGLRSHVGVLVTNNGNFDVATECGSNQLLVGARWSSDPDENAKRETRASLPKVIVRGQAVYVPIEIEAPMSPGVKKLEIDFVTELVRWHGKGRTQEVGVIESVRSYFGQFWSLIDSVEGWLSFDEAYVLFSLAGLVPDDESIIEIGSYKGRSTTALACGTGASTIYAVDPHTGDRTLVERGEAVDTLSEFRANIERQDLQRKIEIMHMTSVEAAAKFSGPKFGMIFIDGWHSTEAVKLDIQSWLPFAARDAIFVFDDWNNEEVGDGIRAMSDFLPPLVGLVGKIAIFGSPVKIAEGLFDGGPGWRPGEGRELPRGITW